MSETSTNRRQSVVHFMEGNKTSKSSRKMSNTSDFEQKYPRRGSRRHSMQILDDPSSQQMDPEIQRKHYEIIQKLLDEFNPEETKARYRSNGAVELKIDRKDFSYDCEMAGMHVRRRLEHLVGTDVVKLNDQKYISHLSDKLQEEYEMALLKREDELAEGERVRLRKLYLEGVIPRPPGETDLLDRSVSQPYKNRRTKSKSPCRQANYPEPPDPVTGIWPTISGPYRKESYSSKSYCNTIRSHSRLKDEDDNHGADGTSNVDDDKSPDNELVKDNSVVMDWFKKQGRKPSQFYDSDGNPKPVKYEAPIIKELKQEETVKGMYQIANKVVV